MKFNTNKGITLIALVITIIVLLILATVSIQAIMGENGMLTKAKNAKNQTEISTEKEQISLSYSSCKLDKNIDALGEKVTASDLQNKMNQSYGSGIVTVSGENNMIKVKYLKSNREYLVLANGNAFNLTEAIKNATPGVALGIADDGTLVDMTNWNFTFISIEEEELYGESEIKGYELGIMSSFWTGGYKGEFVDGRIVGKVPAYILEEPEKFGDGSYEGSIMPVISMAGTFANEYDLFYAPEIPNTVIRLGNDHHAGCFYQCTSLIEPPVIPDSVISMQSAFAYCENLEYAPKIPNGVVNLSNTFSECRKIEIAPEIPESVEDMSYTFSGCTALETVLKIPKNVKYMSVVFHSCENLTGTLEIDANPVQYDTAFFGVALNEGCELVLIGKSTMLNELVEESAYHSNVRVGN